MENGGSWPGQEGGRGGPEGCAAAAEGGPWSSRARRHREPFIPTTARPRKPISYLRAILRRLITHRRKKDSVLFYRALDLGTRVAEEHATEFSVVAPPAFWRNTKWRGAPNRLAKMPLPIPASKKGQKRPPYLGGFADPWWALA